MSTSRMTSATWAALTSISMVTCAAPKSAEVAELPAPELADYRPIAAIKGNLSSVGSDTLNDMMALWQEGFRKLHPDVSAHMEGKGSSTAVPALIEGTAQVGPMSREPKPAEQAKFETKFDYPATVVAVAMDALAVYVHRDNPLEEITLEQLDAVFSKSRNRGYGEDVRTWGQLGLTGDWANRPISMYGRISASGAYGFFKAATLKGGDYKGSLIEPWGIQAVTVDRYGIGYSGIGYAVSGVKKLRIAEKAGAKFVAAESENLYNNTYPLRRFLFVVINKAPGKPLAPLIREFCKYMLSKQGQACVEKDGYFPLTPAVAREQLKKLGIEK